MRTLTWPYICRVPRAKHIRVRVVIRISRVGQHVVHETAVVIDGPEWVAAAAVEDDLHGGLRALGENGSAVAGGVCLAFVAAGVSKATRRHGERGGGGGWSTRR